MSFFDKLKKGVGIEDIEEENNEEESVEKNEEKTEKETPKEKTPKRKPKKNEIKTCNDSEKEKNPKSWFEQEGQLAVDVFQTDNEIYVQSAIAGVGVQDIDITIENDMIIIKGSRERPADLAPKMNTKDYFYQECYWGSFSRQIILPAEVDSSKVEAVMKNGILTVKVPKILKELKKKVSVKGV